MLTTLPPFCAVVVKSGNLNFLEPSGPLQACNGTVSPLYIIYFHGASSLVGLDFLIITHSRSHSDTPHYRAPLDKRSARRRDLYVTIQNTCRRQTSTLPAGFEPAIPASDGPWTLPLYRAAADIGV
jgi:hypothetical protein